jgi:hypothetical protein
MPGKRLAQRRPNGAQLGRGRVDRAESFDKGEGVLGLGAVGQEAAGLPAHPPLQRRQAPLGEGGPERVTVDAEPLGVLPQPDLAGQGVGLLGQFALLP